MSYYETWIQRSEKETDQNKYTQYMNLYFTLEKNAYDTILKAYPNVEEYTKGTALELCEKLGFGKSNMDIYVGFLDGIQTSLKNEINIEAIEDSTAIELDIDFEKLFYNMKDAKAEWLFKLPSWNNVLSVEQRDKIAFEYREANTIHVEKIGRNDPCPCGSGKKYKKCCGK
ncbi:MAG: SEC-C domain-containing protein [Clostridia bacterium]|nr:SEC-C domain-containing protein [Clostridia bacterium]